MPSASADGFGAMARAASGMCAMAQSIIEPHFRKAWPWCGSIEFGGLVSFLLAACALAEENRRLTPTAEG